MEVTSTRPHLQDQCSIVVIATHAAVGMVLHGVNVYGRATTISLATVGSCCAWLLFREMKTKQTKHDMSASTLASKPTHASRDNVHVHNIHKLNVTCAADSHPFMFVLHVVACLHLRFINESEVCGIVRPRISSLLFTSSFCGTLKLPSPFPPHPPTPLPPSCGPPPPRPGGPAWERYKNYRSVAQVETRGRWLSDRSLRRYEKH